MSYIVTEDCIRCRYTDCVEVCPAEAILPDSDPRAEAWIELNREYSAQWPNITRQEAPPSDADSFKGVAGKFDKYFSAKPTPTLPKL